MMADDWRRVIEEAAALGVRTVQFIGGEPTLHPELVRLIRHALDHDLETEVYSNLARPLGVELWEVFGTPGVSLATSYYSSDARSHQAITAGPRGSHRRTRTNIIEAVRRSIPLRVGIVEVQEGQGVEEATAELVALGVQRIDVDRQRQVGRGVRELKPSVDQLCGQCATGRLAVLPSGDVLPCVFSRWLTLGNVQRDSLAAIEDGMVTARVRGELAHAFSGRTLRSCSPSCNPKNCDPAKKS
jgi:MoaA/NifB/PqqE/SkfB family radical SAM enzyme